jgi:hypothetical protein
MTTNTAPAWLAWPEDAVTRASTRYAYALKPMDAAQAYAMAQGIQEGRIKVRRQVYEHTFYVLNGLVIGECFR